MYNVPLTFQCIYGCSNEKSENGDGEEEGEWKLPVDDLVLC